MPGCAGDRAAERPTLPHRPPAFPTMRRHPLVPSLVAFAAFLVAVSSVSGGRTASDHAPGAAVVASADPGGDDPPRVSVARLVSAATFTIDLTPHNAENLNTTLSGAGLTYASPTTTSLGSPQNVTLAYSSAHAAPRGLVQVDVTDASPAPAEHLSLRLTTAAGAAVTFANGLTENVFAAGAGTTRLAAQFDAAALATGVHAYTLTVRKWRAGAPVDEASAPVKVVIVNERASRYGAGWSVAGVETLALSGEDALLTDGDGGAMVFSRAAPGAATYASPAGDFSKLVRLPGASGYRRTTPDSTRTYFSAAGRLDSIVDRFGRAWRYGYDAAGRLARVATPAGRRDTLLYDAAGRISRIRDPGGRAVTLTVDAAGDLVSAVDADGVTARTLAYDAAHRLTHWTSRGGARSDVAYDAAGTVASVTAPTVMADGVTVRPVTAFRSPETAMLPPTGTGTSPAAAAPRVLPADVRARATDPRGGVTHTTRDRFGNPTRIEAPLGHTQVIDRNAHSQVTRTVSPTGHVVRYDWSHARLVRIRDETLGDTVHREHDAYDQVTREHGTAIPETRSFYDAQGQLDSMMVAGTGRVARFRYGAHHQLSTVRDAEGHVTAYVYDTLAHNPREVRTGSSGQRASLQRRDVYGRVVATVDAEGGRDSTVYDLLDRPVKTFDAAGDSMVYTYGPTHLTQLRDPVGQTYGFTYDALGQLVAETDPRGQTTHHRYDRGGNRIATVTRRGHVLSATFDALNRVLTRTDGATGAVTAYAYDPAGLWTMAANAASRDTTFLDAAGRVTRTVTVRGGTRYVLASGYDHRGLRTSLSMTAPWTRTVGYRYDARMQLDTLIDVAGGRTTMAYDADGARVDTRYPSMLQALAAIPSSHVPAGTYYSALAARPLTHGILQDRLGRVSERWDAGEDTATAYTYDERGSLRRAHTYAYVAPPLCAQPTTSTFDPDFGRRVMPSAAPDCEGSPHDQVDLAWAWDGAGNPTAGVETGNRLRSAAGYAMQYDAEGNLVSKVGNGRTQTFTWDGAGRLTAVTTNGATTTYAYDAEGRRVRKTTPTDTAAYLYDGDDLFLEMTGSGAIRREYTYFPGVDQPHSVRQGGQTYYYLTEGPGSVVGLMDGANQLVNRYRYDPFGRATLVSETVPNPLRFTGREYDAESGLYFHRARYYDPEVGRFISEDPIGLAGGINPYVYVENDPVNRRDPFGLTGEVIPLPGEEFFSGPPTDHLADLRARGDDWAREMLSGSGAPKPRAGGKPKKRDSRCGNGFSDEQCEALLRAIRGLRNHPNPECRALGRSARWMYWGDRIVFQPVQMYIPRRRRGGRYPTPGKYDPTTNILTIYPSAYTEAENLMDVIAHELTHKRLGDDEDAAEIAGHACRGSS